MSNYNILDTRVIDKFLSHKNSLIKKYDDLDKEYELIIKELLKNWEGRGAEAFKEDAQNVKSNIIGIKDILTSVCDILSDCRDIIGQSDKSLGESNKSAFK